MIEPQPGTELPSRKAEAPPRPSSQASRIQSQAGKAPPAPCWASPGHSDGEGVWTPDERAACSARGGARLLSLRALVTL